MKIINRQHVVLFAPYIYLYKHTEDRYYVFITIVHYKGQQVELSAECPAYVGGFTFLNFIVEDPSMDETIFTKELGYTSFMQVIKPLSAYEDFQPQTYCVKAQVQYYNMDEGHVSLGIPTFCFYEDADTGDLPNIHGNLALNVPYQLLKKPANSEYFLIKNGEDEDAFKLNEFFDPKCLIFSNDQELDDHKSHHSNGDGSYKQEIWLKPVEGECSTDEAPWLIDIEDIHANSSYYRDIDDIDGSFNVEVYHHRHGQPKRRKGRLRNASAGSNPLGFYDNLKHVKPKKED